MVDYFEIGHIDNTHALKGEIKVRNYSNSQKRFEELKSILIMKNDEYVSYEIENVRYQKDIVLLKLKNVDTIEDAELLKGKSIYIKREDAKELSDGEYFIADLIGLDVYEDGKLVGKIKDIFSAGGADVYVIKPSKGEDILIPAIESVVLNIDLEAGKIEVKIPDALR